MIVHVSFFDSQGSKGPIRVFELEAWLDVTVAYAYCPDLYLVCRYANTDNFCFLLQCVTMVTAGRRQSQRMLEPSTRRGRQGR